MYKKRSGRRNEASNNLTEIEEFRKFLGQADEGYNHAQIRQLRQEMFAIAELLLDLHLMKKQGRAVTTERRPGFLTDSNQKVKVLAKSIIA